MTGYSAMANPMTPASFSTTDTRTLCVPKSTPATSFMVGRVARGRIARAGAGTGRGGVGQPSSLALLL